MCATTGQEHYVGLMNREKNWEKNLRGGDKDHRKFRFKTEDAHSCNTLVEQKLAQEPRGLSLNSYIKREVKTGAERNFHDHRTPKWTKKFNNSLHNISANYS